MTHFIDLLHNARVSMLNSLTLTWGLAAKFFDLYIHYIPAAHKVKCKWCINTVTADTAIHTHINTNTYLCILCRRVSGEH